MKLHSCPGYPVRLLRVSLFAAALASLTLLGPLACRAPSPNGVPAVAQYPKSDSLFPGKGPAQQGSWFVKTWTDRRTQFWQTRKQDRQAVVFLGDSITQGWTSLEQDFPDLKTANRGISGDTTRGILYRMKPDVLDLKPKAVVLMIGVNDIGIGATPEEAAANMQMILDTFRKANPRMPVIVCKVMPSSETRKRPADKIKAFNGLVDQLVAQYPQAIRCDTWSIYADDNGNATKGEFPDLLHPNAGGYAKWAAALKPIFIQLQLTNPATSFSSGNR